MAKTREKKVVITAVSNEAMETAFAEYCTADAKLQGIGAKMDQEIIRIRDRYADDMAKWQLIKEGSFEVLQAYAMENREVVFSKKKSLETVHGLIGFRTGTPKLKTLKGFTWPAVTKMLLEFLPTYVRVVEEPAKDKLLADRDVEEVSNLFCKCGIMVDQDETFFVEPKKEEVNAKV